MRIFIVAILLALACVVSAQFPAGWNYDPFKYYPYSALQPPAQETAEVTAARRAHMAAHALARGKRSFDLETPEVKAATLEFYRAYSAAAAANGIVASLPSRYAPVQAIPQPVKETPEVAAARAAHMAAHAAALARGKRSFENETPEVKAATMEFYRAYSAAAAAAGVVASLPSRYAPKPSTVVLQTVPETPEVAALRAAHMAAHAQALARGKRSFDLETPEVKAATLEFYRAYSAAAAAAGVVASLPSRYAPVQTIPQPVQETPEVAAARAAHMAAHAAALARGKRSFENDTPEVRAATMEFYRAYSAAAAANGIVASLPARYAPVQVVPQPVQETPEVAAARAAHMAAYALAVARG